MVDLIPESYISLVEAYKLYFDQLWCGCSPTDELGGHERYRDLPVEIAREHNERLEQIRQNEWDGIIQPFTDGHLEAFVRPPRSTENFTIPKAAWADMFFPERVFLDIKVTVGLGDYWDALVDRTPFVKKKAFTDWLGTDEHSVVRLLREIATPEPSLRDFMIGLAMDGVASSGELEEMAARWGVRPFARKPDPAQFYPMKLAAWPLAMSIAWIVWRTSEAVCEQWDEYRKDCWHWSGFHSKRPLNGGQSWYEIQGEELVNWKPASVGSLRMMEASEELWEPDGETSLLMSVKSARETLWNNLANGTLRASATDPHGNIVEIPAHEWPYLELAHKGNLADYLINRHHSLDAAYENITLKSTDLLRVWPPQKQKERAFATEQSVVFDHEEQFWKLFDAALWIGCEGEELDTSQIANNALDEIGATQLFKALNRQPLLKATGVNQDLIREDIPATYWELATTDPQEKGHFVNFVESDAQGYWGTLTPSGDHAPRWSRIEVESKALKHIFKFGKSKPSSCRNWLEQAMRDSPTERPMTKAEYQKESKGRFNIGKTGFTRAWREALDNVPEAKASWTKGGRPKTSR